MSFKKTTIRNVFQLGGFTYLGEALSFLGSIVLARLLLPEEYGMVAMIMILSNFAMVLSGVGIGSDIIRSSYGFTYLKAMTNLSLYIGIFLFLLVLLLAYPLALFYENSRLTLPTMFISTQFIFKAIVIVQYSVLMKKQRFVRLGQIELTATTLSIILMILMAWLGFSYWSLIVPLIIADIFKYFIYSYITKIRIKIYPLKYTVVAFRHAKSIIGSILGIRIISYWARNLDNILIGKQFGEAPLGIYNRGYRFLDLTRKLFESLFGAVLYPNLQKLKDDKGDVYGEYLFFIGMICVLSFPVGAVLILFPDTLVRILWGNNWMGVAKFLPYFGLVIISQVNTSNIENLFKIYYKDFLLFKTGVFYTSLMVAAVIFGSFFSPLMIAKSLAVAHIIILLPVIVYYAFGREMKFSYRKLNWIFLPRIFLLSIVFLSIIKGYTTATYIGMGVYLFHLLIVMKDDLQKLKVFVFERLKKIKADKK